MIATPTRASSTPGRGGAAPGLGGAIGLVILLSLMAHPGALMAAGAVPDWQPAMYEELAPLPPAALGAAIDRDFERSDLGVALGQVQAAITAKAATLAGLTRAHEEATDPQRRALHQQILAEKQAFVRLMGRRQALERKRIAVLQTVLRSLIGEPIKQGAAAGEALRLRARQRDGRARFEAARARIDDTLFRSGLTPQSRYAREFDRNLGAITRLKQAIETHRMNRIPPGTATLDRRDYLENLLLLADSDLAILEQEERILSFMAKLAALDAMAFADDLEPDESAGGADLSTSVDFFIADPGADP